MTAGDDSPAGAPAYWQQAKLALSRSDGVLGALIARHPDAILRRRGTAFATLARAVVGQQISVQAAAAVWGRVVGALGRVNPPALLAVDAVGLRACGLSARKVEYLQDLAQHFVNGSLRPRAWRAMDDEAVVAELTAVRGVGRWTAEMFLIFNLQRPDVLPLDDVGLLRAVGRLYLQGRTASRDEARALAVRWQPWRSVATCYLWLSLDPLPVEY